MSDPSRRVTLTVDGVTHLGGTGSRHAMTCGLVVYDRSLDAIMKMFVEGTDRDVDCMTCLVAEARGSK